MRTSIRAGVALSVTGLALSGVVALGSMPAEASSGPTSIRSETQMAKCSYVVTARLGLNVRAGPSINWRHLGVLPTGTVVKGKCKSRGWVKLKNTRFAEAYVSRGFLRRL